MLRCINYRKEIVMSYFKELDIIIQERSNYNPDTRENEKSYLQLKGEINEHMQGNKKFEELSSIAQEMMKDWESQMEQGMEGYHEFNEETENINEERF
jgi:hypothetical protein